MDCLRICGAAISGASSRRLADQFALLFINNLGYDSSGVLSSQLSYCLNKQRATQRGFKIEHAISHIIFYLKSLQRFDFSHLRFITNQKSKSLQMFQARQAQLCTALLTSSSQPHEEELAVLVNEQVNSILYVNYSVSKEHVKQGLKPSSLFHRATTELCYISAELSFSGMPPTQKRSLREVLKNMGGRYLVTRTEDS